MTKEEYRRIDDLEVSNLGNIKKDGVLLHQYKDIYYCYIINNNKPVRVHPLVAKAFPEICGEWFDGCAVHHLDHNQLNNRADNLIILTPSVHKKAHQLDDGVSRKVAQYDGKGNLIGMYISIQDAAHHTGICFSTISRVCKNSPTKGDTRRYTAGGFYWIYADEDPEIIQERIKYRSEHSNKRTH